MSKCSVLEGRQVRCDAGFQCASRRCPCASYKVSGFVLQLQIPAALTVYLLPLFSSNNEDTQRNAVATLSHISNHADGRMHIFRSGGIAALVRMLRSPVEAVVHYAVTTLHNLLIYLESAKEETIACHGLEALVPLLNRPNPKLQAMVRV